MTAISFWAGHGVAKVTKLANGKVLTEFHFEGLIPFGVYTLWNVLETEPFKDEPYTAFGAGRHALVADGNGRAHKVVLRDSWPGKALRKSFGEERPHHGLASRLARSLRTLPSPSCTPFGWHRFAITTATAMLVLLLTVTLSGPQRAEFADVPLTELEAFIDSNRSVDVATDDPARVRDWLAQRVNFAPPLVARGSMQIELIGGRLCVFAGRRVASYMYRVHGHLLSIYIVSATGLSLTGGIRTDHVGRTLAVTQDGHLTQVSWIEDGLIYAVVGELSERALLGALDELNL
jgi:anti-sigma factor RsiW